MSSRQGRFQAGPESSLEAVDAADDDDDTDEEEDEDETEDVDEELLLSSAKPIVGTDAMSIAPAANAARERFIRGRGGNTEPLL